VSVPTILHFADLHLGVESYGHPDPATGMSTRLGDFLRAFDQAIDEAIGTPVDLVVFAGDAYKTRDPTPTQQREFAKRIARLAEADIPTVLLVGNHDLPLSPLRADTLDIFATLNVPNVWVARKPAVRRFETRRGPVQVAALPWVMRHTLLTKEEMRDRSVDELNRAVEDKIGSILAGLASQLDPDAPAILTAHCSHSEASFGSERSVMLGQDITLPLSLLAKPCFRYVALGHIHKHQTRGSDPPVVYAGSLERIDFGEENEDKGYVIVHLEGDRPVEVKFRTTAARRFVTIEVTCRGDDPLAEVRRAVGQKDLRDAVVRLIVHAKPEHEAALADRELRALLREAHYVAGIRREIEQPERRRPPVPNIESWTPLQALKYYLEQRDTPPERLAALLDRARALGAEGPL
jgi:exonuclease SbcD